MRARANRILALTVVRLDGQVDRRRWIPSSRISDRDRRTNLLWALSIFEVEALGGEPTMRARRAEALARIPGRGEEARAILADLSDRDLMPDAWGHRALAELSDTGGDHDRRDREVRLCQVRAGNDAHAICPEFAPRP